MAIFEGNIQGQVCLVDDDPGLGLLVERWLTLAGYEVSFFESGPELLNTLNQQNLADGRGPDAICLDLGLPDMDGLEVLRRIKRLTDQVPVIILTADSSVNSVVTAMQEGAYDYLPKPLDRTKLTTTIRNAVDRSRLAARLARLEQSDDGATWQNIVGASPRMQEVFRQGALIAGSDVTVLVHGESGTGKELIARALHTASPRAHGPFVALNCAAIPEGVQESELFGHEKGAFTGAVGRRVGCFERADGGTLLLDEVAELSPPLQAKLLRVLQERTFHRVGGTQEIHSNFRLLTATHKDLSRLVAEGHFREDLFFRLAVFELILPPLRERRPDIPLLARYFLKKLQPEGEPPIRIASEAMELLMAYAWPGNVRELQNALQYAVVIAQGGVIETRTLPPRVRQPGAVRSTPSAPSAPINAPPTPAPEVRPALPTLSLEGLERMAIEAALERYAGQLTEAARQLGIGRTTLYRKLKRYGLR